MTNAPCPKVKEGTSATEELFSPPSFDPSGRAWVETEGRRKTAKATVRVTKPGRDPHYHHPRLDLAPSGTGKVMIKHKNHPDITSDITYFFGLKDRHAILYPLQVILFPNPHPT